MIALDLTPTEEAEITTIARQTGLAPADYLKRLVKEHLPSAPAALPLPEQDSGEKRVAAIALLESWIAAQPKDPEEIRRGDAERNEFLQNLNRNRIEAEDKPKHSIMKLHGLGAEIWKDESGKLIDAQEYVNELRHEWDHR